MSNHETWSFGDRSQIQIDVEVADTWWGRFRGLMLRKPLPPAAGLWLNPTNSIHMCFMRFAIDAVYFNKNMEIVKIVRNLHPWLGLSACLKASSVLEMKAGDRILLCSDGLTNMVEDKNLEKILVSLSDSRKAAEKMIEQANEKGGLDNIAVIVAKKEEER